MIKLSPKKCPELKGCKRFRSHTDVDTNQSDDLGGVFRDRVEQAGEIGKIKAVIETLRMLPCEGEIQVGSKDGRSFNSGEVKTLPGEYFEHAGIIIEEILNLAFVFSQSYGESSFTISARLTFRFTEIQR